MTHTTGRSRDVAQLVAALESSPGSGVFEIDDRLAVEEVALGSDAVLSTARLAVRIDAEFDTAAARARYAPDLRVVVRTNEADPSRNVVLFEGHPPVQEARWRGGPGRGEESFGFVATHVYERLSRERTSWIYGRQMRSGAIKDGLAACPADWADRSVRVEALPCVFNLDGALNCSPTPLTVTAPDGSARSIYIFTHDDDPNGVAWTYVNALRYLVWFHMPRNGPMFAGNVFDATDAFVAPPPPAGASTRLIRRLSATPASLACEATNLVESLTLLADAAGVHVTAETIGQGAGVRSQFRIWATGDGMRRSLKLARGGLHADGTLRFNASSLSASDVFRANQVSAADIRWDDRRIVNAPVVIGGVKGYEMTTPLAPGWLPTVNLDNVAAPDRAAAKALALTPEQVIELGDLADQNDWFRQYHRSGSEFADHRYVARRWVLNEDGRFDGPTYNRNAPFHDYQPFDFSTVTTADITRRGAWSRRSRPLLASITRTTLGAGFGVFVEVSFDGGLNWCQPHGPVSVVRGPTAIVFDVTNPTQVTPPGVDPLEQNMWYAIIDQTFRVRVTAVIESDDRLIARPAPDDAATPTLLTTSRVAYRPETYRFISADGTSNVLRDAHPNGIDGGRDDAKAIALNAAALALREQDRRVSASPVMPWLDTAFAIGDEIADVRGRGVSFVTREDAERLAPAVVGKRFRFGGGRWETSLVLAMDA